MSRRQLIGLVAVVATLLIVGIDVLVVHHFGKNAATKTYPDNYLNAVACPSATQCWAVGQTGSAPGGNTLSEPRYPLLKHETAGHWSTVVLAAPGPRDALEAIACPGATDCWAVGGSASSGQAFIEHWAGGAWQLAASPAVRGGQLTAIGCASPDACWAIGGTQTHSGVTGDLLERWNGSQWAVVSSLAGGLHPQQLSCPVRGYCLALGLRDGAAAAAAYTAGGWTTASPPSGTLPSLFGCAGPTMCLAAYDGTKLVTDVWNGSAWAAVTSSTLSYPVGLTCSGGKGCWLLGMTRKFHPLALRWQGNDWVPATVPAVHHSGYLSDLACGSGCWAVGGEGGDRRNGDPYTRPLIAPLA